MNTDRTLLKIITGPALLTAFLLLIPLTAKLLTDEMAWSAGDFIAAGIMIFGTGLIYKLLTRKTTRVAYRIAVGFALVAGLSLIWVNLAVGIIGSEDNLINVIYLGIPFVGIIGAIIARFRSEGMAWAMGGMALAQALAAVIALSTGKFRLPESSVTEILSVNGFFILLFIVSALLFRYATVEDRSADPDRAV